MANGYIRILTTEDGQVVTQGSDDGFTWQDQNTQPVPESETNPEGTPPEEEDPEPGE